MKRNTFVLAALAVVAAWRSTWVLSQLPDGTPAAGALRSLVLDPFWLVFIIGGGLARALWR